MKKKFLWILLVLVICLTGCGKGNKDDIKNKFINDVENIKSYYMEGKLSITNNDDTYDYDVKTSYSAKDNFKVSLTNKSNNYEQIILRNSDGVYVVNPSLNKSFKFQSEWPYNNSQSYLLNSPISDLKNDKNYEFEQKDKNYIFTVKVNYPNNPNLVKETITLDKDLNLKIVKVLDKDNIPYIIFNVNSLDKKAVFADNYFKLETVCKDYTKDDKTTNDKTTNDKTTNDKTTNDKTTNDNNKEKETLDIDDALFPLYLPQNTSLTNREIITTDVGERVIMTFSGDNPFILVQENVIKDEDFTTIPTSGDPYLLVDTVGALTSSSYTWISNNVEYYIVSDVMAQNELLEVAKSINVVSTMTTK